MMRDDLEHALVSVYSAKTLGDLDDWLAWRRKARTILSLTEQEAIWFQSRMIRARMEMERELGHPARWDCPCQRCHREEARKAQLAQDQQRFMQQVMYQQRSPC